MKLCVSCLLLNVITCSNAEISVSIATLNLSFNMSNSSASGEIKKCLPAIVVSTRSSTNVTPHSICVCGYFMICFCCFSIAITPSE
nr:MAG TPA: hypothetical protein [Caudoviricetes sp.]